MTDVLIFQFGSVRRDRAGRIMGSDCKSRMTGSCHALREREFKSMES